MGFQAPITQALGALYAAAAEHGFAELDQSALFKELQRRQDAP
jgi:2-hydroxy-3-oxopropionate reductase